MEIFGFRAQLFHPEADGAPCRGELDSVVRDTLYNKLILFAKNYGLLGLITSSVYNRDIVGEDNVLFSQNNIISNTLNYRQQRDEI